MPAVFIKTLGCKVNNYDAMAMLGRFAALGYSVAESSAAADIIILNTCSVTQNADREARYLIRKMHRENPTALLVATGCYAQTNGTELMQIEQLHLIVSQQQKERLAEIVDHYYQSHMGGTSQRPEWSQLAASDALRTPLTLAPLDSRQTRATLRIQDGCESYCSYCIIPYARGPIRSVPASAIITEVKRLDAAGVREIVLTGIHLGQYGKDLFPGDPRGEHLSALVSQLITEALTHARLRLSSLEPMELDEVLMELAARYPAQLCGHFHLPLQAGADRILRGMNRPYDAAAYLTKAQALRAALPGVNITTDVIVGFPGESDDDFTATCQLVAAAGITKVHVFPYSPRQGTAAAELPGAVDPPLIATRAMRLREQSDRQEALYRASVIGQRLDLLWEESFDEQERRIGRAQNYLEAILDSSDNELRGTLTPVIIIGMNEQGMLIGRKL